MNATLRKSFAAKFTALSFIILILACNAWMVQFLLKAQIPEWIDWGMICGCVGVALGALGLLVTAILTPTASQEES